MKNVDRLKNLIDSIVNLESNVDELDSQLKEMNIDPDSVVRSGMQRINEIRLQNPVNNVAEDGKNELYPIAAKGDKSNSLQRFLNKLHRK